MFPTLYRYILREIVSLFLAIIIILLAIILSFRLSSLLSSAVAGDISLSAVWKLIGLQVANMLITLMPVALILASIMTLSRLYRDQEISALFAGGIGRDHLHRIILIFAIPLAALLLLLTLFVLPDVSRQTITIRDQARQQAGFALLTPNSFRRLDDGTIIYTGEFSQEHYSDFFIAQNKDNSHTAIFADTGNIRQDSQEQYLDLGQGIRSTWTNDHNPTNAVYTQYQAAEVHLPSPDPSSTTARARDLPTSALTKSHPHQAELQNRLNPALAMLIFCLCLPMLAHTVPRKARPQKLLPAFILFALYINTLDLTVKAIAKGKIPIFPGSYSIHILALSLTLIWWLAARRKI